MLEFVVIFVDFIWFVKEKLPYIMLQLLFSIAIISISKLLLIIIIHLLRYGRSAIRSYGSSNYYWRLYLIDEESWYFRASAHNIWSLSLIYFSS